MLWTAVIVICIHILVAAQEAEQGRKHKAEYQMPQALTHLRKSSLRSDWRHFPMPPSLHLPLNCLVLGWDTEQPALL